MEISRQVNGLFSSVMYHSTNMVMVIVPWIAVASSVFFAFSPWATIKEMQKSKTTLKYTFQPYYFYTLQSFMFLLYAMTTSNTLLCCTTGLGVALGLFYMKVFYQYAIDKKSIEVLLMAGTLVSVALTYEAIARSGREAQMLIGIAGNIVMILTAASPLAQVKSIIRNQDSSCLPYGMSAMNALAGGIWTVYGILLEDMIVIFPNFITLIMGIIQLAFIFKYPSHGKSISKRKKVDTSIV